MARVNTLVGESIYVTPVEFPDHSTGYTDSDAEGESGLSLSAAPDAVPHYVAFFVLLAVGIIAAIHFGGLRAMVAVGS